jgi:hypothetical protein
VAVTTATNSRARLCVTMAASASWQYPVSRPFFMWLHPANLTFKYEFTVAKSELRMREESGVPSEKLYWVGQGNGQADDEALQCEARLQAVRAP